MARPATHGDLGGRAENSNLTPLPRTVTTLGNRGGRARTHTDMFLQVVYFSGRASTAIVVPNRPPKLNTRVRFPSSAPIALYRFLRCVRTPTAREHRRVLWGPKSSCGRSRGRGPVSARHRPDAPTLARSVARGRDRKC